MLQEVFMKSYDAIIIGFGKGGKTLAGYMAKQGKRVAMIEKIKSDVWRYLHQRRLHSLKIPDHTGR